jgi:hypothetical protein
MAEKRLFSISDMVTNVPAEGVHLIRLDEITAGVAGENANVPGAPLLKFKGKVVSGEDEGKTITYSRTLQTNALGFLGADLTMTGLFDTSRNSEEKIDIGDPEGLAALLTERMVGRVFQFEVKHQDYRGRTSGNYSLVGPSTL